jgi:hypothetical protein
VNYTFNIDIRFCATTILYFPTPPPSTSFIINTGPTPSFFSSVVWSNQLCLYSAIYSVSAVSFNGSPISTPLWLSLDNANLSTTFAATQVSDVGTYIIEITGTIPQPTVLNPSAIKSATTQFTLNVITDCTLTYLIPRTIPTVVAKVSQGAVMQDVFVQDQTAIDNNWKWYCNTRTYVLSPSLNFLSISGDNVIAVTTNPGDDGIYNVNLTASLTFYPAIPSITIPFVVIVQCEVLQINVLTPPAPITTYLINVTPTLTIPFQL